jgi:hypothetical protein
MCARSGIVAGLLIVSICRVSAAWATPTASHTTLDSLLSAAAERQRDFLHQGARLPRAAHGSESLPASQGSTSPTNVLVNDPSLDQDISIPGLLGLPD